MFFIDTIFSSLSYIKVTYSFTVSKFFIRFSQETTTKLYKKLFTILFIKLMVFQYKTKRFRLLRFKDIISKERSSHLVYKFMCSCCNATYYGELERHFFVRISENLGVPPLTGKPVKSPKSLLSLITSCWRGMTLVLKTLKFSWKKKVNLNYTSKNPLDKTILEFFGWLFSLFVFIK